MQTLQRDFGHFRTKFTKLLRTFCNRFKKYPRNIFYQPNYLSPNYQLICAHKNDRAQSFSVRNSSLLLTIYQQNSQIYSNIFTNYVHLIKIYFCVSTKMIVRTQNPICSRLHQYLLIFFDEQSKMCGTKCNISRF